MPSGFLNADIQMPDLTDAGKDVETRLKETQDYLYLLLENLRYTLNNLEPGNFNEAGLKAITDPITASIADADGRITQLAITAEGLELSVQGLENQTTVYVDENGLIVENGSGNQVYIGNGAVAADFFYGQKYYEPTGTSYMTMETWGQHSSFVVCNGNHDDAYLIVSDLGSGAVNFGASDNHAGSMSFMSFDRYNGITRPVGTWDFSSATVTGLSTVATFG